MLVIELINPFTDEDIPLTLFDATPEDTTTSVLAPLGALDGDMLRITELETGVSARIIKNEGKWVTLDLTVPD